MLNPSAEREVNNNYRLSTEKARQWWNNQAFESRKNIVIESDAVINDDQEVEDQMVADVADKEYDDLPDITQQEIDSKIDDEEDIEEIFDIEGEEYLQCSKCDDLFTSNEDYDIHKSVDHGEEPEDLEESEETYQLTMNPDLTREALQEANSLLTETEERQLYSGYDKNGEIQSSVMPYNLPPVATGKYNDNPNEFFYSNKIFRAGNSSLRTSSLGEARASEGDSEWYSDWDKAVQDLKNNNIQSYEEHARKYGFDAWDQNPSHNIEQAIKNMEWTIDYEKSVESKASESDLVDGIMRVENGEMGQDELIEFVLEHRDTLMQLQGSWQRIVQSVDDYNLSLSDESIATEFSLRDYEKNEDINYHAENALQLVKKYGTQSEIDAITKINKNHMEVGHLVYEDSIKRGEISNKYFDRLLADATEEERKSYRGESKASLKAMKDSGAGDMVGEIPDGMDINEWLGEADKVDYEEVDYEDDGVSDISVPNVEPKGEDKNEFLDDVDNTVEEVNFVYPTKATESTKSYITESEPFEEEYEEFEDSDDEIIEETISIRKLTGYSDNSIAQELHINYGVSHEEALEKVYSVEVSTNDRVAQTFFGKMYKECTESEKDELRMYSGSD